MRLPGAARLAILAWANIRHIQHREPDFRIGPAIDPYLLRWYVYRHGQRWRALTPAQRAENNRDGNQAAAQGTRNLYVHRFLCSDDDRALHDHPWAWRTILLDGRYIEHVPRDPADPAGPTRMIDRAAGTIGPWRAGTESHRIELLDGCPVTTLFQTGPREREWGFWCKSGWRHWQVFTDAGNAGTPGRGCE